MTPVHESTLPPILTKVEMAALLGVSVRTLARAMQSPGWLFPPLSGTGGRPRWARDAVLATLTAIPSIPYRRRA